MADQRPFDALDLGLLLFVAPLHPLCFALVLGQWFVRRSPAILASAGDLMGQVGVDWGRLGDGGAQVARALLPGAAPLLTSGGATDRRPAPRPPGDARDDAPRRGPRPRWLQVINDEPDQRPHTLILGPTRSGKTTMATAAMADRGGRAVVITPKVNPSNWRGAEIVTLDDDGTYAPIAAVLDEIEQEKRRRIKVLRAEGAEALEPLTIVFDEIGDLAVFEPRAPEMMTNLSSIGAELRLRIIGIGTSDEALGIKRWKATRNNYVRVEMNSDRRATINDGVRTVSVQPSESLAIATAARLRPWRGEEPAPPRAVAADAPRAETVSVRVPERAADPDALLAAFMAELPADVRAAVPDISPERAGRLAQILGGQQTLAIDSSDPREIKISMRQLVVNPPAEASAPDAPPPEAKITKPERRERREGAIDLRNRRRRLERKAYYQQAAREDISLQAAYDARPRGEKGDYNEAAQWYREAKRAMRAS